MRARRDILLVNVLAKVGQGCICDETGIESSHEIAPFK